MITINLPGVRHAPVEQTFSPSMHASISLEHLHLPAWQTGAVAQLSAQDGIDPQSHDFVSELYVSAT